MIIPTFYGVTFVAIGPRSLVPTSYVTVCSSERVLNPSIRIPLMCTNKSDPPSDGGNDLFVHLSGIQMEGFKTLSEEQTVTYQVGTSDRGPIATNVTP